MVHFFDINFLCSLFFFSCFSFFCLLSFAPCAWFVWCFVHFFVFVCCSSFFVPWSPLSVFFLFNVFLDCVFFLQTNRVSRPHSNQSVFLLLLSVLLCFFGSVVDCCWVLGGFIFDLFVTLFLCFYVPLPPPPRNKIQKLTLNLFTSFFCFHVVLFSFDFFFHIFSLLC